MVDALYARQSVEKTDSISMESQLEACRYEARGQPCREYADRGFSGKDTNRPAFTKLLEDVRQGDIRRVIVYKLDRISRSILDFANMMEIFGRYGVEFISSTERFDTSTPIGRAMLHICIVFAQLERETIQRRVTDAYYARCRRGFYMGGRVPYGYAAEEISMDGIRTLRFVPVPEEAAQVAQLYRLYADPSHSLGDLVREQLPHLRGGAWTTARLSELLRNPVYVRADAAVYQFFKEQGVMVSNPPENFIGCNGCYLYKGESEGHTQHNLVGRELVLAPHEGLVEAELWLRCRRRTMESRRSTATCKAKNSWLSGKVKCALCGHALSLVKSSSRHGRYFVCSHALATKKQGCPGTGGTIYADVLEQLAAEGIVRRLTHFPRLSPAGGDTNHSRLELVTLTEELEKLLGQVPGATAETLAYISCRTAELTAQREILSAELHRPHGTAHSAVVHPERLWAQLTYAERQAVADICLEVITAGNGTIDFFWRIPSACPNA